MALNYQVQQGDCIGSIAYSYGFTWETLWNHPENAALKQKRRDPNFLLPGDLVFIPDLSLRQEACATDQLHSFELKDVPARLQLRLFEEVQEENDSAPNADASDADYEDPDFKPVTRNHKPRGSVPYLLDVDGVVTRGQSDGDGFIKIALYPAARSSRLVLFPGTPNEEVYPLQLGGMDPLDEIAGIKKRLINLGLPCDAGDQLTPEFAAALMLFQERSGLPLTGEADAATRSKLKDVHGG